MALNLGAHESIAGGLQTAFERGVNAGCECLQIWTKNGRQWDAPELAEDQVETFWRARVASGIAPVVAHASYLINIATPNADLFRRSTRALIDEVERCEALGLPYLILHPGSHTGAGEAAGLAQVGAALGEVHSATPGYATRILLETTSGQGQAMGSTFENLRLMLERASEGHRLGVCFDTCHVFAAGYDLRTPEAYAVTMEHLTREIGLERLAVLHLNDSKSGLGERKDRHEHIGKGQIGLAGFELLLNDVRLAGLPAILETPKSADLHEDIENLATLRSLYRQDPC